MKRFPLMPLVVGLLLAADAPKDEATKKALANIQGTWTLVTAEADGQALPADKTKGGKLVIKGDKYAFQVGDQTIEGVYKVDPTKKPMAIDARRTNSAEKSKTLQGIFQVEGDELKMCFGEPGQENRPTAFATKAGGKHRLYVFKRGNP